MSISISSSSSISFAASGVFALNNFERAVEEEEEYDDDDDDGLKQQE